MAPRSDDDLAAEWHELMGRYNQLTCKLDRELGAAHDLSSSEFEVLQQLQASKPDGRMRMADLANQVHLSQSALSRLVGRLERDGMAVRDICAQDRRSVWTKITPDGRKRYRAARATQRAILRAESSGCTELAEGLLLPRD